MSALDDAACVESLDVFSDFRRDLYMCGDALFELTEAADQRSRSENKTKHPLRVRAERSKQLKRQAEINSLNRVREVRQQYGAAQREWLQPPGLDLIQKLAPCLVAEDKRLLFWCLGVADHVEGRSVRDLYAVA